MALSLVQQSATIRTLVSDINYAIHGCAQSCGFILVGCKLDKRQLRVLKKKINKENAALKARFLYDGTAKILAIFFEGLEMSQTHWMGLVIKASMQSITESSKGFLVAHYEEQEYPTFTELEKMIRVLTAEEQSDGHLVIYKHEAQRDHNKRSILIIDDDKVASDFLKIILAVQGYAVYQAYDGVQGVRTYEELHPDAVIMELNLPAMDGYQVIRNIQSNAVKCSIIILSEQRLEKDVTACYEIGVTSYLTKPYSPKELEETLQNLFNQSKTAVI